MESSNNYRIPHPSDGSSDNNICPGSGPKILKSKRRSKSVPSQSQQQSTDEHVGPTSSRRLFQCSFPNCNYESLWKENVGRHEKSLKHKKDMEDLVQSNNCSYSPAVTTAMPVNNAQCSNKSDNRTQSANNRKSPAVTPGSRRSSIAKSKNITQQFSEEQKKPVVDESSKSKFECTFPGCNFQSLSEEGLTNHLNVHVTLRTKLQCPQCALSFFTQYDFTSHAETFHHDKFDHGNEPSGHPGSQNDNKNCKGNSNDSNNPCDKISVENFLNYPPNTGSVDISLQKQQQLDTPASIPNFDTFWNIIPTNKGSESRPPPWHFGDSEQKIENEKPSIPTVDAGVALTPERLAEKLFKCPLCPYTSQSISNVKAHGIVHTDLKPYACSSPACDYRSKWPSNIKEHEKRCQNIIMSSPAAASSDSSSSSSKRQQRVRQPPKNQPRSARKSQKAPPSPALDESLPQLSLENSPSFPLLTQARIPGRTVVDKPFSGDHHDSEHKPQVRPADYDDDGGDDDDAGAKIAASKTGEFASRGNIGFPCPQCSYRGQTRVHLKSHIRVHNEAKPFACSLPGCAFRTRWSHCVTTHERNVHGLETTAGAATRRRSRKGINSAQTLPPRAMAEACSLASQSQDDATTQENSGGGAKAVDTQENNKWEQCAGRTMIQVKTEWRDERETLGGGDGAFANDHLERRARKRPYGGKTEVEHTGLAELKHCSYPPHSVSPARRDGKIQRLSLQSSVQDRENQDVTEGTTTTITTGDGLSAGLSQGAPDGAGDGSWQCPHCEFNTPTKGRLWNHLRVHKDEKPFPCPLIQCNFRSKWRSNVREHLKRIHGWQKYEGMEYEGDKELTAGLKDHNKVPSKQSVPAHLPPTLPAINNNNNIKSERSSFPLAETTSQSWPRSDCLFCMYTSKLAGYLRKHIGQCPGCRRQNNEGSLHDMDEGEGLEKDDSGNLYKCMLCDFVADNHAAALQHGSEHKPSGGVPLNELNLKSSSAISM